MIVIGLAKHAATVLADPQDCFGLGGGQAVPDVDGHQPQLVVAQLVDTTQDGVVIAPVDAVTHDHVVSGRPQLVGQQ